MYEGVTYQVLLERMLGRVPDKYDKREGSVIFDTHSPTALELEYLYIELEKIMNNAFGDTASREFLIRRCKERGITPYPATNAVLRGEFTPTDIDMTGHRFSIDTTNYVVGEKISDGIYQVQCETSGSMGNLQLGEMIPIDYVQGLETARLTELLIPGEDEEDTEDLRTRYFSSFGGQSFGGNVRDYIEKTNSISGVGSTKVTRCWNSDLRPAEMVPTEAVKEWYSSVLPILDNETANWLETVFKAAEQKKLTTGGTVLLTILNSEYEPASDTLVQIVQDTIDPDENTGEGYGLAPIGHVVKVKSAEAVELNISLKITLEEDCSWELLQPLIIDSISDYFLSLKRAWANSDKLVVRIKQIETVLMQLEGVIDVENTAINGKRKNYTLGAYEIPVLGEVQNEQ